MIASRNSVKLFVGLTVVLDLLTHPSCLAVNAFIRAEKSYLDLDKKITAEHVQAIETRVNAYIRARTSMTPTLVDKDHPLLASVRRRTAELTCLKKQCSFIIRLL